MNRLLRMFIDDDGGGKLVFYFEKTDERNEAYKHCGYFVVYTPMK